MMILQSMLQFKMDLLVIYILHETDHLDCQLVKSYSICCAHQREVCHGFKRTMSAGEPL